MRQRDGVILFHGRVWNTDLNKALRLLRDKAVTPRKRDHLGQFKGGKDK